MNEHNTVAMDQDFHEKYMLLRRLNFDAIVIVDAVDAFIGISLQYGQAVAVYSVDGLINLGVQQCQMGHAEAVQATEDLMVKLSTLAYGPIFVNLFGAIDTNGHHIEEEIA